VDLVFAFFGLVACLLGGVVGGFLSGLARSTDIERRLDVLERRFASEVSAGYGSRGQEIKKAKADRQGEALAKLMLMLKDGGMKDPKAAIASVALEYPDVAFDLAGKAFKN